MASPRASSASSASSASGGVLNIKRFDPRTMSPPFSTIIMGEKGAGKSTVVKDIMFHHSHNIPMGNVILNSDSNRGFYECFVPKDSIKTEYKQKYIRDVFFRKPFKEPPAFIIMDDSICCDKIANDIEVKRVLFNSRHSRITCIVAMHYPTTISCVARCGIDYIFIMRNSLPALGKIYLHYIIDQYRREFPDFDTFLKIVTKVTAADHGCLVIANTNIARKGRKDDFVFWYKAASRDSFQMGDKPHEEEEQEYVYVYEDGDFLLHQRHIKHQTSNDP